jgi:hypothetical protein
MLSAVPSDFAEWAAESPENDPRLLPSSVNVLALQQQRDGTVARHSRC